MKFTFPKDFMFGAATSAVQIEGSIHEGGKGEDFHSDNYKKNPALYNYSDPAKNADFYHKYPEDIKMMKDLGLKCFRFSISWSRIFPDGPYKVCQEGIDYYNNVINELKKNGIKAFFDLWHCDMPLWLVKFVQKCDYFQGQLLSIDKFDSLHYNSVKLFFSSLIC